MREFFMILVVVLAVGGIITAGVFFSNNAPCIAGLVWGWSWFASLLMLHAFRSIPE
jgi:hypothetical protein